MKPDRLNALTDGVVAIVLTIMVLELKFPEEPTFGAVLAVLPLLAAYLLAFIYVAIYWNNHHHMMQSAHKVTGAVLWANARWFTPRATIPASSARSAAAPKSGSASAVMSSPCRWHLSRRSSPSQST
jgi:uncharacterized membrane protein